MSRAASSTGNHSTRSRTAILESVPAWRCTRRASTCGFRSNTSRHSKCSRRSVFAICCGRRSCCVQDLRSSVWEEQDGDEIPFGQKTFLVDGEDYPILELRRLEFAGAEDTPQDHASAQ